MNDDIMGDNLSFQEGDYTEKVPVEETSTNQTIWSVNYYRKYFQVDSDMVMMRTRNAFIASHKLLDECYDNPDLWGPFWISTTLISLCFMMNALLHVWEFYLVGKTTTIKYDLSRLYTGFSFIYPYVFGMPLLIWAVCRYYASTTTFFTLVNIYGYIMVVWIPVAVILAHVDDLCHSDLMATRCCDLDGICLKWCSTCLLYTSPSPRD